MGRRRAWTLALWSLAALAGGCNFTEDLDAFEAEVEARRDAALPEASPLCQTYCELSLSVCTTSSTRVFDDEAECFTACADYVSNGIDDETSGDTVQCRIYHLTAARDGDPITHCPHTAPDGGGVCIGPSPCGSYCGQMQEICLDFNIFPEEGFRDACVSACLAYPNTGIAGDTSGDTFQCRQRAALAARNDPSTFCPQAAPDGGGVCVAGRSLCDTYCDLASANCTGDNTIYTSLASCQSACAGFRTDGDNNDTTGDTLQCRLNRLEVAAGDPGRECFAGAADGGGVCVD